MMIASSNNRMNHTFKFLSLLGISSIITIAAHSQVDIGVKAGLNLSKAVFDESKLKSIALYNAGILSQITFSEKLFLRPEVLYAIKGWSFTEGKSRQCGERCSLIRATD
jgi:hypothetical protein